MNEGWVLVLFFKTGDWKIKIKNTSVAILLFIPVHCFLSSPLVWSKKLNYSSPPVAWVWPLMASRCRFYPGFMNMFLCWALIYASVVSGCLVHSAAFPADPAWRFSTLALTAQGLFTQSLRRWSSSKEAFTCWTNKKTLRVWPDKSYGTTQCTSDPSNIKHMPWLCWSSSGSCIKQLSMVGSVIFPTDA